ncbi:MAG: SGNH/GDSL hydrolase family protein [Lentisphaerota bacterium]
MKVLFIMTLIGCTAVISGCNTCGGGSQELVRYDGKISNQTRGWQFMKSEAGKMVYVPFEGYYESKGGRMQSPIIKLDKQSGEAAYYSLKFKAKTSEQCYWWVDFFDAEGKPLPDTNSAVYPGKAQADYDQMLYIQSSASSIQLAFQSKGGVAVSDIAVKKVPAETAASWNDTLYAELPALEFHPSPDSFKRLPRTASALKSGKPWKVVMLGDSIMNDSYNSVFQALIKRDFPQSNLDFIISVRGSTGCWFYQDPKSFAEYVARYKPDLLMIGGISNLIKDKDNIPAGMKKIENVIDQAKALGCEVVLLSPPHSVDWRTFDSNNESANLPVMKWSEDTLDQGKERRLIWSPYEALAKKCDIAFWNMTVPTADYVAISGKPHDFFNRDHIHNNDRGKQIIGRVLQKYFLTANNVK